MKKGIIPIKDELGLWRPNRSEQDRTICSNKTIKLWRCMLKWVIQDLTGMKTKALKKVLYMSYTR